MKQVVVIGLSCVLFFSSYVRNLFVQFLKRDSGKTAALQPESTFLGKAEKFVKFVNL